MGTLSLTMTKNTKATSFENLAVVEVTQSNEDSGQQNSDSGGGQ